MKKKQIIMLLSILVVIAGSICFFCFHSRIIDTYSQDNKTMKIYSNGRVAANGFDEKDVVIAAIDLASRNKLKSAYYVYKYILDRDKDNFSGYIGMANIYESLNNYNEALKYVDEIESIAKGKEDKYEVIRAEYHKAELYRLKTEYEGSTAAGRAIEYYLKTIRDGNEFSGTKIQRMLLDETIKRSLEEVANLYYKQADYRNAISCFNSLLDSDNTVFSPMKNVNKLMILPVRKLMDIMTITS